MSFSSAARNAFVQQRVPVPDLIPVPRYGDLWLVAMDCGHVIFSNGACRGCWLECSACGAMDMPVVSVRVSRG